MNNLTPQMARVSSIFTKGANMGIAQIPLEKSDMDGRTIKTEGNKIVNFGSCSYLGLETDERLKFAAIQATLKYGTQFSCSRAYLSIHMYEELEMLLEQLFGHPCLVAPSTSLGHISNIPTLVGLKDAVILDHQVHASVQSAAGLLAAKGIHIETVRHNRMDYLEESINRLKEQYHKIWYMADGVYSSYGDTAHLQKLYELLEEYDQFYLYLDDAHGMGWKGKNGSGFGLSEISLHPKMALITSLNKSFAAAGGALIFPNKKAKKIVRDCGGSMIFSGPIQPPMLGAAIASAKIHLSPEIDELQSDHQNLIKYFLKKSRMYGLPIVSEAETPIFFVGVGKGAIGYRMVRKLMDHGFFVSLAIFPSVAMNKTGLRITLTRHHTIEDIDNLLSCIATYLPDFLKAEDYGMERIYEDFSLVPVS